jgi:hypothetical protein
MMEALLGSGVRLGVGQGSSTAWATFNEDILRVVDVNNEGGES